MDQMSNIPKALKAQLQEFAKPSALKTVLELKSKDGTIKRAYECVDGQVIESVLMPYEDGRYTACISSQAGCAQGCVFCATGQMGFSRQLTPEEIYEQVARFAAELQQKEKSEKKGDQRSGRRTRLSNIVFMGMGEPLANYRHVKTAVNRIQSELGIGARRITISTVGIVPNIRKLHQDPDMPPVRLALSLHCATDEERDALLPANRRYGGLDELMPAMKEYMEATGRRVTLEWALIDGQNDTPATARQLGELVSRYGLRRDMVHVNVIPLNPTGGYGGSPSQRPRVNAFCDILQKDYGISCTPRVRRGIDIDAGCGQLKSKVMEEEKASLPKLEVPVMNPTVGVYEDDDEDDFIFDALEEELMSFMPDKQHSLDMDHDDFDDVEYQTVEERNEASRLLSLVQGTTINLKDL